MTDPTSQSDSVADAARDLTFFLGNRLELTDDCRTAINRAFAALEPVAPEGFVMVPRSDALNLYNDLNARIGAAHSTAVPVFAGIVALHDAIHAAPIPPASTDASAGEREIERKGIENYYRCGFRDARYFLDPSVAKSETTPEEDDYATRFMAEHDALFAALRPEPASPSLGGADAGEREVIARLYERVTGPRKHTLEQQLRTDVLTLIALRDRHTDSGVVDRSLGLVRKLAAMKPTKGDPVKIMEEARQIVASLQAGEATPVVDADPPASTGALVEALQQIAALGADGEHSGDRHARCRDIAYSALAKLDRATLTQPQSAGDGS